MRRSKNPLSAIEWTTCWMAIRYAMGRQSASSASLPTELLAAYYNRWNDDQRNMIIRDLREYLNDTTDSDTGESCFGNKNIDHPIWMRFLLTLDEKEYKTVYCKWNGVSIKAHCIEYMGKYYQIDGSRVWWLTGGAYIAPEFIYKVEQYSTKEKYEKKFVPRSGIRSYKGKVVNNDPMTNPEDGWVEGWYFEDLEKGKVRSYIFSCPCRWEVFPESVGQYTGFNDDDGVPIYVGDIIEDSHGERGLVIEEEGYYAVVDWKKFANEELSDAVDSEIKCIGNNFDNPELFEKDV